MIYSNVFLQSTHLYAAAALLIYEHIKPSYSQQRDLIKSFDQFSEWSSSHFSVLMWRGLWRGGLAESRALIKALEPGDQHAALIVNGNEGINAVCITIDPHNTEKAPFAWHSGVAGGKWQAQRCCVTRHWASWVKISSRRYPSLCKWMVICTAVCARCSVPQSWCKKNWMTVSKTAVIIKLITKCWWCP